MEERKCKTVNVRPGDIIATGKRGDVVYDPVGWACNMGYAVFRDGVEVSRGPQWVAHIDAQTGIPFAEQEVHPTGPDARRLFTNSGTRTCSACGKREASDDPTPDHRYLCEDCL